MTRTVAKLVLSIAFILAAFGIPQRATSDDSDLSAVPAMWKPAFLCDDPAVIDSAFEIPVVSPTAEFHSHNAPLLCWNSTTDPRFYRYRIEISLRDTVTEELFKPIDDCYLTDPHMPFDTCLAITETTVEDTIWYRVRWVDSNVVYSLPSNTIYSIRDVTPPEINDLTVVPVDRTSDNRWIVEINYDGVEQYPDLLLISENLEIEHGDRLRASGSYQIDTASGTVRFTLSPDQERKYIFAQMIDKAGNASEIADANLIVASTSHNYPNPFNPNIESTRIVFNLPSNKADGQVRIIIYDLFGNLVREMTAASARAGIHDEDDWNGRNGAGAVVADGGYVCVIKAGDDVVSRHKIAVAK